MANLRVNLDKGLYDALNVAAVIAEAKGGIWNSLAPKSAKPPYIVFQASSKIDDYRFNGRGATARYIVKAVSHSPWPKEAATIDTQIDVALQDAALTIAGFSQLLCRRDGDFYFTEIDMGEVWQHMGGIYQIMVDQS